MMVVQQATRVRGLVCKDCGAGYSLGANHVCSQCFGPLEVDYDLDQIRELVDPGVIARRAPTLWRYRELLPVDGEPPVNLGAGFTPLLRARRLGQRLGLKELYLKNDAVNPSYSFKDRVVSVAVAKAVELGFDTVACASTGNLAGSLAAHAAAAGLACYVFIPADLEPEKILGASVYGARIVAVEGTYDQVNRLCVQIADELGWAFVNINLRPYYSEGSKTLAFETAEQLGWELPDHVVVPIAGGSVLTKIGKGFDELRRLGWVADRPVRVSGAQAEGCNPVVRAWRSGARRVDPVRPATLAKSLAIGNPADGLFALETIRRSGGSADDVTDPEIVAGIRLLAETEGIFAETAGGVTVAVLKKLVESGRIRPQERTVAYITGNGFKTVDVLRGHVPSPQVIAPKLASFKQQVLHEG